DGEEHGGNGWCRNLSRRSLSHRVGKLDDLCNRTGLHTRGCGHFLGHRQAHEPNPTGGRHWNCICSRGGSSSVTAQSRGGRRRGNQKHVGRKYFARYTARSLGAVRAIRGGRYFSFCFPAEFPPCLI